MWKPGDVIAWRGIYGEHVWHVQPTIVIRDTPEELVMTLLPGTECVADENYPKGKQNGGRRWEFQNHDWNLAKYTWHTNRLLILLKPGKYYSTILFWDDASNEFLCHYINFQLPFARSHCGIDTLDLDLDLIIHPDLRVEWKDVEDYKKAIEHGLIEPEWISGIEAAKSEILARLEKRQYPFGGSWLGWRPDPDWSPPTLPEDWDKI